MKQISQTIVDGILTSGQGILPLGKCDWSIVPLTAPNAMGSSHYTGFTTLQKEKLQIAIIAAVKHA